MSKADALLASFAIVFISIACGWLFRLAWEKGHVPVSQAQFDRLRRFLQSIAIYIFMPLAAMLSLWGLAQPKPALLGVPFLGFLSYLAGGGLALVASRVLKLDRAQTGSFFCCGTFTNIGAVGGVVCLLFLGEDAIALVALYRLVEEVYFFGLAFPLAQWFGQEGRGRLGFRSFRISLAVYVIVAALLFGIGLNLGGVKRPDFLGPAASAGIVACTVSLLFAIGMALRFSRLGGYRKAAFAMCLIKFAGVPLLLVPLAMLMGYGQSEGGLVLRAVAILAAMPVAMTALVPPALFGLDVDLANSCWIATTAGLVIILPALALILPLL